MKKLLISSAIISLLASSLFADSVYNKDGSVNANGLRNASLTAGSQNLPEIKYTTQAPIPGQVKVLKKSYVTAPPMIPHSVKSMLPITFHNNQCLQCHKPAPAKALGITSMPKDHFVDTFEGNKKTGKRIAGSRFNCTQCHAPQAILDPVVENKFHKLHDKK